MSAARTRRQTWTPDVLGEPWQSRAIPLGADAEGPLDAVLVRSGPARSARAVLYLHGFVDYFFQTAMAQTFLDAGYDFYALDLRKHGRALHQDQTPNYVTELAEYATEIDEAEHTIRTEDGHTQLVVLGHSTGGLIASLWAHARPGHVDALVLNSPWLDLNESWFHRVVLTPVVAALARVAPRTVVGGLAEHYGRALHRETGGEWDYDLAWKPHEGFPVRAAWFSAVRRGHARVARGLDIGCPVLVCTSDATGDNHGAHPGVLSTDSVLSVEQIHARAPRLGRAVTVRMIPGGAHDLALSAEPARTEYLTSVHGWLAEHLPRSEA